MNAPLESLVAGGGSPGLPRLWINNRGFRPRLSRNFFLLFILHSAFIILHSPAVARANEPATQPSTQPTTRTLAEFPADSPYRDWFRKLADVDPQVRERAQIELMGMTAGDLPAFRRLVAGSQPLSPAQAQPLHDIVQQVFLASEKYIVKVDDTDTLTDPTGSVPPFFMGIRRIYADDMNPRLGAPVEARVPGFPAFRALRDGDMILSIGPDPATSLPQRPTIETHSLDNVIHALTPESGPQLQDVVLTVLRDGQEIRVPLRLAPRPFLAAVQNPDALNAFEAPRISEAEEYWNQNFGPLVDREIVVDAE